MDHNDDLEVGLIGQDGERTMLADFGEATVFEALLYERGSEIAAVFLEPILGSRASSSRRPNFSGALPKRRIAQVQCSSSMR